MVIENFSIYFVEDTNLDDDMICEIIKTKQQYWNYSYDEHKKWMNENINRDERHLIMTDSSKNVIAYLNIVKTSIIYNDIEEEVLGIGNVCVDKNFSGKGIGKLFMNICNYYLSCYEKRSILLCKPNLVKFYEKSGWIKYEGEVSIKDNPYSGELMFTELVSSPNIRLTRNF